ncbi:MULTISPECIES: galactonate dehydratase [unclassified Paenibacillus]|uniref:galactonate dehydratase n=1 Tax=unclassified Paenibacillus TaxID=185978 RepID=UPI001AE286DE|nr:MULTISPECIES: galactonate dehydratase [unclassified Paenibacillus]MBP1153890.1 galactonate dehydratase [Paenibacillus sp. PvP091]MBP1170725.1 galactonate dehydratase [Paenibacillus sp. PvR098]MBP2441753.1 galactonate dehydratase [Paenibacillus sp. PvP052]
MKIKSMELFQVPPRWLFLKVTTDDGIVGWGEPIVEGKADTVRAAVEEMSDYLIGKDAGHIEDLWQVLYRGGFYRGGPILTSAISGIEQALWDIKGKRLGVPVYELLGGPVRDKMRVYAWIGGDKPIDVAEAAGEKMAEGYTAVKMNGTAEMEWIDTPQKVQEAVERLAAVREAIGWDIGIGVDLHGRVHKTMAKVLIKELEPFKPMFIEEPVLPENNEVIPEITRGISVPIATGERMYTRWDFKRLLTQGGVDIIQPDLSHAGGIWEVRKIAAMAEAFDVAVAPHCPLGPIALAASLQLDFCTPNAFIQEQSLGIHYNQGSDLLDYLADPAVFHYQDGFVRRLAAPGLGVEINESKVREMAAVGHRWRNPVWRNEDGTVTEW